MSTVHDFIGGIDELSIDRALQVGANGYVHVNSQAFDLDPCSAVWRRTLASTGGDRYRTVEASQGRVILNAIRPLGNTYVRGSGFVRYGAPEKLNKKGGNFTEEQLARIEQRYDLIEKDQEHYQSVFQGILDGATTPQDKVLAELEMHQVLTGGGFDNTTRYDTYETAFNFALKQKALEPLDDTRQAYVVASCIELREWFRAQGVGYETLEPSPYEIVRADQNTDGTIGFPIFEPGGREFSQKVARGIKAAYGVNLYDMIGTHVDDRSSGYSGKARNLDAISALLKQTIFSVSNMAPLITIFPRIQKHGFKLKDGKPVAKPGKARAVFAPDAVWGGVHAMIGDAWQKALMRAKVRDFPSLFNPEEQAADVFQLVSDAMRNGFVVLSTDESQYDATLMNDVMATIMHLVVKPFFKKEYHRMVDLATLCLMFKVLVFPDNFISAQVSEGKIPENYQDMTPRIKGSYLVPCVNGGLISGAKLTHIMGSMYGRVVCHKCFQKEMGYEVPKTILDGVMAGDDNAMLVLASLVDLSSPEAAYSEVERIYKLYGLEVNPAKQIHIVYNDEPLTVFLQKAYHCGLRIKGVGSAARQLVGVDFSEHGPELSMEEQWIGQLSVMNNGWNSPFIDTAVEEWLKQDAELLSLFHNYGLEAWDMLIEQAGSDTDALKSIGRSAYAYAEDADEIIQDIALKIVPIVARVAQRMDVAHEEGRGQLEADDTDSELGLSA